MGISSKELTGKRIRFVEAKLQQLIEENKGKSLPVESLFIDARVFMELFRIAPRTLRRWQRKQLLPYSKMGGQSFFKIRDVREFVERAEERGQNTF